MDTVGYSGVWVGIGRVSGTVCVEFEQAFWVGWVSVEEVVKSWVEYISY